MLTPLEEFKTLQEKQKEEFFGTVAVNELINDYPPQRKTTLCQHLQVHNFDKAG